MNVGIAQCVESRLCIICIVEIHLADLQSDMKPRQWARVKIVKKEVLFGNRLHLVASLRMPKECHKEWLICAISLHFPQIVNLESENEHLDETWRNVHEHREHLAFWAFWAFWPFWALVHDVHDFPLCILDHQSDAFSITSAETRSHIPMTVCWSCHGKRELMPRGRFCWTAHT